MIIDKNLTSVIDTDLLGYSMYVLENRAIPSAIDGLKMGGRKLLYSMINDYPSKKVKVAELAGSIAKYGFHHGESSAEGAAVTLTADWNNNCPIFTGHGNFGSRLIQEASASRYIYLSLSDDFKKYFGDTEVAPKSTNEENPEPAHYLPLIPWVLVNYVSGIAVGFACDILPRSVPDLIEATRKCVKNPTKFLAECANIKPTFPHFKGEVVSESDNGKSWSTIGCVEYIGKYTYKITELPIGYDRESYIAQLNKMIDSGAIKDYEDNCSSEGFGFSIKVTGALKEVIDKDPVSYFKLKKYHSDNLTTLGYDGKLKIFQSVAELIHYFVSYRTMKFGEKILYDKNKLIDEIYLLNDKVKFIDAVVNGIVSFKNTSKDDLLKFIYDNVTIKEYGKSFIKIPLYECTVDEIGKIVTIISKKQKELIELDSMTPSKMYLRKLDSIK